MENSREGLGGVGSSVKLSSPEDALWMSSLI